MATPDVLIEILKSNRGKEKACIDGFLYTLKRSCHPHLHWICEKRATCKARITTKDGVVINPPNKSEIILSHTHAPEPMRVEMIKGITRMKDRAVSSEDTTRSILSSGLGLMTDSSISALPKLDSLKRRIRRQKSLAEKFDNSASADQIIIPEKYKLSIKGEQFLLYDSEINDTNRLLVFGTRKMLTILRDSSSWYADGTFKVVPSQFFQLYTIHCEKDGYIIPCVYALMTNKREVTYNKLFKNLIEIEPDLNPSHIMVDFEKASLNALEENFIAVVSGCFFHLSQSIYRQIQAKGLTTQYLEDQDFAIRMKMLASLAFVPEHDVIDSFTILMGDFPESAIEIAEYFEKNYIGIKLADQSRRVPPFPIRIWNMHTRVLSKLFRTNNSVEGWHNGFASGINCSHPSFIKLLMHLQREQSLHEATLIKWETGEISKPSKKSEARNTRIFTLVEDYHNREILTFLRGIAHNFEF